MTDTTTPPGQIRYPEPPDHWRPPRYLRDEIARIQAQERLEGQAARVPLPDAEKRSKAALGPFSQAFLDKYGFVNWQAQEMEQALDERLAKMERLKMALLTYLNREEEYIRDSDGVYRGLMVPSEDIREILEQSEKST